MGKLFDRVVRLEDRFNDKEELKYLRQRVLDHDEKIAALAAHLNLRFEAARFSLRPVNED